jgi:hypothetical protein
MRHALLIATACLTASPVGATLAQAGGKVTVYRCTDAAGRQSLRDTPCPAGQAQQARDMLRPKDAPPRPAPAATPAPVAQAAAVPVVVYRSPPQPLYECVTPDGDRYTSETGDGNPRWVPLWTLGWPTHGPGSADRGSFRPAPSSSASIGRPQQQPLPAPLLPATGPHRPHWAAASGGGTWIRDTCAMLPPAEVCDRLRDRRDAIRTRFFNAQEKERDALRLEERGILARLDDDCGGR